MAGGKYTYPFRGRRGVLRTSRRQMNDQSDTPEAKSDNIDLEELLRQKEKLDSIIRRKFTKIITVMFTDLSGSTRLSEELGDLTWRAALRRHNDILFPIIEKHHGHLVKTMGDGTMSYFDEAPDAVRAAVDIQIAIRTHNHTKVDPPFLIRCGLNTGMGIVEKTDVYGDVVNVAQRYESLASPQEIFISDDTFAMVKDSPGICVFFLKEANLKGKAGPQKVYKVLWDENDILTYRASPQKMTEPKAFSDGAMTGDMVVVEDFGAPAKTQVIETAPAPTSRLVVEGSGAEPKSYPLTGEELIIGRSQSAHIHLPETYVSRKHARVVKEGGLFYIEDLQSNTGTLFRGAKIKKREMANGDEFIIGSVKLRFESHAPAPEPDAEATVMLKVGRLLQVVVTEAGAEVARHDLSETPLDIGRMAENHIHLSNPAVSRMHAKIYMTGDKVFIEDKKSNNGTFVNGEKVEKMEVGPADEIKIGPFTLRVFDPTRSAEPPPSPGEEVGGLTRKVMSFFHKK